MTWVIFGRTSAAKSDTPHPAGEYANPNQQDQTALRLLGDDWVTVYRFGARTGEPGVRPLQINFYDEEQRSSVIEILGTALADIGSAYVTRFLAAEIDEPDETLYASDGEYRSARARASRGRLAFYALLAKARFRVPTGWAGVRISMPGALADLILADRPNALQKVQGGYIQVRSADGLKGSFVDPRRQAAAVERQIVNGVLPGSNVSDPGSSSVDTWRHELYELFRTRGVSDFGGLVSMLDGLGRLYGDTGTVEVGRCPEKMCNERQISVPLAGCQCPGCGAQVWPTDVLRTHEEFDEDGSNLTPVGRVMNFCERLLLSMYIEGFARSSPESLGRGIFISDGPLALFGTVAPIKRRFVSWWQQMTTRLNGRGAMSPLVVGIEKSGAFADHAAAMTEFLTPRDVLHMDDAYIRAHIAPGRPGADPYGKDEFFGRKFIYKTSTDNVLVVTVPRITGQPYAEAGCESLDQYPTLAKTLAVLDGIQTRLYKDAVIPVALAHSVAAIPLGTGTRVLEDLARQALSL